jgi:hypothetical protein
MNRMESILRQTAKGMQLEILLPSTGIDRVQAAREALQAHYLTEGMVEVVFLNASSEEADV